MAEVRKRTVAPSAPEEDDSPSISKTTSKKKPTRATAEDSSNPFTFIEIARFLCLIILCSCLLSWFVTGKDLHWGIRPAFTTKKFWQDLLTTPIYLTDAELKTYDGTDPTKPIYLALNGTIYDVSNGRNFYGPGGSYHFFAGADGTRAFITSCFDIDITPDTRGIELMYIPTSTPEIDAQFTKGQLKTRIEQEKRLARQQVEKGIRHWVDFFENSPKYRKIGYVKREEGWWDKLGEERELCDKAQQSRPVRKPPSEEEKARAQAHAKAKGKGEN